MTQSTLRFLIGGLLAVGALASLARGDEKCKPELLPPPRCQARDQEASCCQPGAPCCEANEACCEKTHSGPSMLCVGKALSLFQFDHRWDSSNKTARYDHRVFPVVDLIANPSGLHLVTYTPQIQAQQFQMPDPLDQLTNLIQTMIQPESWSRAGGSGTIEYFPLGKVLVVNQSADVQEQVTELLNALRRLQTETEVAQTNCPLSCSTPARVKVATATNSLQQCGSCPQAKQETAQSYPVQSCPTVFLVQQSTLDITGELMTWALGALAESICDGLVEKTCPPVLANAPSALTFVPPAQACYVPAQATAPTPMTPAACPTVPQQSVQQVPLTCTMGSDGLMRIGVDFNITANTPSPLPSATPTFRIPPAMANNGGLRPVQTMPIAPVAPMPFPGAASDSAATRPMPCEALTVNGQVVTYTPPQAATPISMNSALLPSPIPTFRLHTADTTAPNWCTSATPGCPRLICSTSESPSSTPQAVAASEPTTRFTPSGVVTFTGTDHQRPAFASETVAVATKYVAVPPPVINESWTMRVRQVDGKSAISMHSEMCSGTFENLKRKWMQNSTLEFTAGRNCIQIRGKDFMAQAECVECHEREGVLVFSGHVTLTSQKKQSSMNVIDAQKLMWNCETGECQAEGAASMFTR